MIEENQYLLNIRNIAIIVVAHILMLVMPFFIGSVIITFVTNMQETVDLFDPQELFKVSYEWMFWLYKSWVALPMDAYNHLKVKLLAGFFGPYVAMILMYFIYGSRIRNWEPFQNDEKVHGSARWATESDIKKSGLRSKDGMLLGKNYRGYFVADGFQHALLFAPTGSGKGVGFVIPNLLFWEHSVVVHDIKLENYQFTSGWRQSQGNDVYVWEPANPDGITHCYNPIDWISEKPGKMVDDVQKISNLLVEKQDFWNNEARSLFVGILLYLLADATKTKSFGEITRTLRSDDVTYNLAVVLDTLGGVIHPVSYMNLAAFLQKADKERSGVISTLNSELELWANPLIDIATASSDFNILDFKKKKTTIYVGLTPDNLTRLQKLMRVFYQQATDFLCAKMPDLKEEPFGVMFLMDEFPTLGKMEQFKTGIAYFRGYRVRLFLIVQDTQQLKGTYEDAGMNSFLSNSTYRITFAANNYETANMISQLCGNKTVKQASQSLPRFFDMNPSTRTINVSEVQRALLLPQEVIQLPRDEQIVLIESQPPIRSNKIKYYEDKFFLKRLLPQTFVPTQVPLDSRKQNEEQVEEIKLDVDNIDGDEEIDDIYDQPEDSFEDLDHIEEDDNDEVDLDEFDAHDEDDNTSFDKEDKDTNK